MERNGGVKPPLQGRWRHDSRRGCSINFGGRAGGARGKAFGEGVAAEEERGVEGVASEGVPEKRDAGDVTGKQTGGGMREAAEELPDGEIGDEEELDGAEERGEANARDG